jgi:hypothetical protein
MEAFTSDDSARKRVGDQSRAPRPQGGQLLLERTWQPLLQPPDRRCLVQAPQEIAQADGALRPLAGG